MQQADVIDAAAYPQGSYPPYDAGGYPQDQQGYYRPPGGAPGPDAYRYDPRGAQWGSYPGSAGQGQYPGYQEQYPGDYRGYGQGEGDSQGYPPRDWRA